MDLVPGQVVQGDCSLYLCLCSNHTKNNSASQAEGLAIPSFLSHTASSTPHVTPRACPVSWDSEQIQQPLNLSLVGRVSSIPGGISVHLFGGGGGEEGYIYIQI